MLTQTKLGFQSCVGEIFVFFFSLQLIVNPLTPTFAIWLQ